MEIKIKDNQGYVALITVLIVLAVSIIVAVSAVLNSTNEMQMGYASGEAEKAFNIADACADEALLRLKREPNLSTIPDLSIGEGSCIIQIENLGGESRRLKVTGLKKNIYRLIEIELTVGSDWQVVSWKEVGEFTP